jgi:hypothetical protein
LGACFKVRELDKQARQLAGEIKELSGEAVERIA